MEVEPEVNIKEIEFTNEKTNNILLNEYENNINKLLPDNITISIRELVHPHFGCYLWPGSYVLASYIWNYRYKFVNATTIELGSGVSLPSLLIAKLKYEYIQKHECLNNKNSSISNKILSPTIITDISNPRFILSNIQKEVKQNNLRLNEQSSFYEIDMEEENNKNIDYLTQYNIFVEPLYWGIHDTLVEIKQKLSNIPTSFTSNNNYKIDYILAADNFFIPKDYEDILSTVSIIFRNYPNAKFITTYQERSSQRTIQHLLDEWNMKAVVVPLSSFNCNVNDLVVKEDQNSTETSSIKNEIDNNLHFGGSIYSIFLLIIESNK
ncbi:hypothetical protein BCR36DRAFT_327967 [Piromyces finnis]|uniref:Uncharacterized protein n=1 Tax=Piromyces finnis TaxID=1754191 RepID=A0A1Y1V891_9FUNG|nr:hypothetical protein BCR36DRAFT_327967 [Piromyces finnis]|eukprot:ORX49677.1 hypothetical protein BCR36DRAFT_327967 [Piromyces finnis]